MLRYDMLHCYNSVHMYLLLLLQYQSPAHHHRIMYHHHHHVMPIAASKHQSTGFQIKTSSYIIMTDQAQAQQRTKPLSTPIKIYQTDFSPGKGNALQAAVASIFGLDLSKVPNFIEVPEGYEASIRTFCHDHGSECIKIALGGGKSVGKILSEYNGKLCILRGKSPRGDFGHVVVAKRENDAFQMMHDPHPEETFLDEGEDAGWCMFFL